MAAFQPAGSFDDVPRDIYNATDLCRRSLRKCQTIEPLMKHGWAENRLADFNLWAAGVGASAPTKASLDWRLHFQPTARIVLTNLLAILTGFVEECIELGLGNGGSSDPAVAAPSDAEDTAALQPGGWEEEAPSNSADAPRVRSSWFDELDSPSTDDESSADSSDGADNDSSIALTEAMGHTEGILDQLIRLGHAIRKSGTSARLRRADGLFKEDDYQDLRRHLSLGLLLQAGKQQDNQDKSIDSRIAELDQCYDQLSPEQKQLITANLLRRNRFVYARRHQRKLEGSLDITAVVRKSKPAARPIEISKSVAPSRAPQRSTKTATGEQLEDDTPKTNPGMTITTASVAEGDVLKATATYSQAQSRVSVTTAKLSYPSPPPVAEGKRSFKCPCCYQPLPMMFTERARWRKHLAEDLAPYTCPFSNCTEAGVLYITRQTWRAHINTKHGASQYWECLPCQGTSTFSTADEFATHTQTYHGDTIADTQLPAVQDLSCRTVPPVIASCPICPESMPDPVDPTSMLEHIGDCIHEFSLKALPWAETDHSGSRDLSSLPLSAEKVSNEKRVFTWLDGMEPTALKEQDFDLRLLTFAISPPAPDQLFVADEYFAEGSDHSGSAQIERPSADSELSELNFSSPASSRPGSQVGRWTQRTSETGTPEEAHSEAHDSDSDSESHLKEGDGWKVVFNRNVPRVLDVDLVHTLQHDSVVLCVRFSADGKYVATGCGTGAQIFDVINGEKVCVFPDHSHNLNDAMITSVCFSPDGRYLVTGGEDTLIRVWDLARKQIRNTFRGHVQSVGSLDFARDGRTVASGGDNTVRLWDIETGTNTLIISAGSDESHVYSVAISPDNKLVAAGLSTRQGIRIWDIKTGHLVQHLWGPDGHISAVSVAFSSNGRELVSGSVDRTIKLWELSAAQGQPYPEAGRCIQTFEGHEFPVRDVAFTSDAQWVLSGSWDHNVGWWDPRTGQVQFMLKGHADIVNSVAASPAGRYFATGSNDGMVRIWSYTQLGR